MKTALVCGAGGFIGCHLVKKLQREGFWVRNVDIKPHEWSPNAADETLLLDLREEKNCQQALTLPNGRFDEVYQLAADMGGMGFIHSAECEIMHNSALINIHMIHNAAAMKVPRYFFSSSVCVYRDMKPGEPEMTEAGAIPANPDNENGWHWRMDATGASRCASLASRTAMGQKAPGSAGARKRRLPCAGKWRRSKTAGRSKSGEMEAPFALIPMWKIWWKGFIC
jgi:nucleoside-diphosphate-sugar epimerase